MMATVQTGGAASGKSGRTEVARLFDETRRRLVESGTRNRLVHVNRANTRGNVINIVNERSDDVYDILSGSRTMRFLAIGQDKADDEDAVRARIALNQPSSRPLKERI